MGEAAITRRFRVTGRVQGVYFRQSARLEAERLAITGLARNLPDGSVEVIAHGPRAALDTFREWLHRGPTTARVASVQELPPEHQSLEHQFPESLEHRSPQHQPNADGEPRRPVTFRVL